MKIWCQSCGAIGKDPVWYEYEKAMEEHAKEIARPDTVVEIHGCDSIPGLDQYYASQAICRMQSIRNAIRAEQEGYDAFVMISNTDQGYHEIREVVDIPVVFILENSIFFSLMFAQRFAFLTHNSTGLSFMTELARQYGLTERMVEGGYLKLRYTDWTNMFKHPDRYVEIITQKAKEIVARGAGILIGVALPISVWCLKNGLAEIDGARVLDGFGCAVKMGELMVDLKKIGISRIKSSPPSQELLAGIQKLYTG